MKGVTDRNECWCTPVHRCQRYNQITDISLTILQLLQNCEKFPIQWKRTVRVRESCTYYVRKNENGLFDVCVYVIKCMCVCLWTYPSWLRAECCMFWIWCCCHPLIEPRCRVLALLKPDIADRSALLREYSKRKHMAWVNICFLN